MIQQFPLTQQFEVRREGFTETRIATLPSRALADGEARLVVDRFSFTANNVTYAAAGDALRYWTFFPASAEPDVWGVIPVWGFADVVESCVPALPIGTRVFGYLPPATEVVLRPARITPHGFSEGSPHRRTLRPAYNSYRIAPHTDSACENERALLYPLHITAFALHDAMREAGWHGAEQIAVLSASSKTSLGLAFALRNETPATIGLTSPARVATIADLDLYDTVLGYDAVARLPQRPTLVVDMSGNAELLQRLHAHLGGHLARILKVGLTHHDQSADTPGLRDRSTLFFAPDTLAKRMADWGPAGFAERSDAFLRAAAADTRGWLRITPRSGLTTLQSLYPDIRKGRRPATEGLVFTPTAGEIA